MALAVDGGADAGETAGLFVGSGAEGVGIRMGAGGVGVGTVAGVWVRGGAGEA
jgi:hypothetical protein